MFPSTGCKSCLLRWGPPRLALLMAAAALSVAVSTHAQTIPSSARVTYAQGEGVAQQIRIETLLERARAARKAGRLVQPPGDNAAEYYAEVLKLDPGNVEARDAIIGLHSAIRTSLAKSHGQSVELQRLDTLASKLTMQPPGNLVGASPVEHYASHPQHAAPPPVSPPPPPPPPPTVEQAPPPPAQHAAPPPVEQVPPPPAPQTGTPAPGATPPAASNGASAPLAPREIDRILANLPYGNIVFNTPDRMSVNRPQTIQVELSASATVEALQKKITAAGPLSSDRIQISDQLDVHLTGANFLIQAMTPESQPVGTLTTSHWEWRVTPTQSGAQQLELTLNAVLRIDGVEREFSIQTYNKAIDVNVDWPDLLSSFVAANWQWLWTTLFVPVVVVAWRRFRAKKPDKAA